MVHISHPTNMIGAKTIVFGGEKGGSAPKPIRPQRAPTPELEAYMRGTLFLWFFPGHHQYAEMEDLKLPLTSDPVSYAQQSHDFFERSTYRVIPIRRAERCSIHIDPVSKRALFPSMGDPGGVCVEMGNLICYIPNSMTWRGGRLGWNLSDQQDTKLWYVSRKRGGTLDFIKRLFACAVWHQKEEECISKSAPSTGESNYSGRWEREAGQNGYMQNVMYNGVPKE